MSAQLYILIVDDDPRSLTTLRRALSNVPAEIVEASSGDEALECVKRHDFAVAVLDVQMEGMDGYELAERLRTSPDSRGLPIIFMSGSLGDEDHVFRGYESGAVDYLLKPVQPRVLQSKVGVFLDLAKQRLELSEYGLGLERMVGQRTRRLEAKAHELDVVMEGAPVALVVTDLDGRVLRVNRAAEALLGHRREELIGRPVDVLAPVDARPTHEVFGPALSHFHLGSRRIEVRGGDGKTFPARCNVNVVEGPDGSRRIISIEDVRPNVELEKMRAELNALLRATDSAVLHLTLDFAVLDASGHPLVKDAKHLSDVVDDGTLEFLRVAVDALDDEERVWQGVGGLRDARPASSCEMLAVMRPRCPGSDGSLSLVLLGLNELEEP
ncbi:MAG: response regulator [Gemmatimonadota bacterium]